MKYEPVAKKYYDALNEGRFLGLRCPECGHVEFPPYPACNECGHIGNDWVDLTDADVIVNEIYAISPMMTIGDFMPYAPLFACEAAIKEGDVEFTCLVFGITKKTYKEIREQVPLHAKFVAMPMDGYNSFAVSINGAVPEKKGQRGHLDVGKVLDALGKDKKIALEAENAPKADNGVDGVYKCVAKVMGQKRSCNISVNVNGETSTGILEVMDESMQYENGTFKDGQLEFSIEARGSEFVFSGTVGEGRLDGMVKFGMLKMEVEGERI